jgi:hypothetical protein
MQLEAYFSTTKLNFKLIPKLMTQEEYIKNRVDDQITWYGNKSSNCQKKYKIWQVIKIVALLFITIVSLWGDQDGYGFVTYIVGALGAFIIFIESFIKIYDYKKLWVQYRMASENLTREKLMFETKSAPYNISEPFILFVERCEAIMQNEMRGWQEVLAEEDFT